jgi:methylated-DNA-protein-cysteine methyltransferase-like protein
MTDRDDETPTTIVKRVVQGIPAGRAASYGTVGRVAAAVARPIGGARTVAWILASLKGKDDTPWHRVVGAGGVILLPDRRGALQASRLRGEGVRIRKGSIDRFCLLDEPVLLSLFRPRRPPVRPSAGR